MPDLIPVLSRDDINESISAVANRISSDYHGCELVLVGVLKGAFVFLSDLVRNLTIPAMIDFVRISSYGAGTSSSESIKLSKALEIDIHNKDVLIVEDIIDTGLTITYLMDHIKSFKPKTVRVCTLIDKLERRKTEFKADYVCHAVEKGFLVGFGLDYAEKYRGLSGIYHLKL